MNKDLLTLQDLAARAGAPAERVAEWTKVKLLKPDGYGENKAPLFPVAALDRVAHLQRLADLGYGTEEILKIAKKVGLPHDGRGRKKSPEKDHYLTVGNLAERSGVSPRTIKHWEDKGIIEPDMRTEGGFRLYSESYVVLCQLIRDLQLFGYSLEEIKAVSDDVRTLLAIEADLEATPPAEVEKRLAAMLEAVRDLSDKMKLLEEGIERWRDLLKKKKKDIVALQGRNRKRSREAREGKAKEKDRA
ncbi:MAG TPA: MerR family transcriptional regulator [Candidatus Aminicenantes bacterium]|nr:MerR family transcriptional regulator [Candidatus Aminicenantes bacterium]HRY63848.1 MerR family transcriptional regulator [Candidatus Aminicenantes bacterium]HRZ70761.1 MerR family transcriptional regulator [Candidatus Aminicenantes bacterium]